MEPGSPVTKESIPYGNSYPFYCRSWGSVARRATCKGIQYTIADILGVHTVTVHHGRIGCSCGLDRSFLTCEHIRLVEAQEVAYAEEAARRAAYTEAFDIYG